MGSKITARFSQLQSNLFWDPHLNASYSVTVLSQAVILSPLTGHSSPSSATALARQEVKKYTRPAFCLHLFYFINKKVKFILDPIIYKYLYFDALALGVSMTVNLQKDSVWSLYLLSLNLEVTISWCFQLL